MTEQASRLAQIGDAPGARAQVEAALIEIKRVIVGQEGMLGTTKAFAADGRGRPAG